eukprot:764581-Hanusia_phi.AAC.5
MSAFCSPVIWKNGSTTVLTSRKGASPVEVMHTARGVVRKVHRVLEMGSCTSAAHELHTYTSMRRRASPRRKRAS